MRNKIIFGGILLLGVAACDVDTGDPHGEGADVVETPSAAGTGPSSTVEPTESPATPSEQPTGSTSQPGKPPTASTRPPSAGPAEPTGEPSQPTEEPQVPRQPSSDPAGTYANPLPAGTAFVLSDRIDGEGAPVELWEIVLWPTDTDATDEVLAENEFNEIADGRTAVMTEVTATYIGPETGNAFVDLNFTYLGNDGNTFAYGSDDYCGVIPDDLTDHGEQFPGATATGSVCQAVPEEVIEDGMWIVALAFTWEDRRVFVKTD